MRLKKYKLGELIELCDERNSDNQYKLSDVKGISTEKAFIDTKANMDGVSLESYKVVNPREFSYVSDTSRRGDKIALAFNNSNTAVLISSIYTTFKCNQNYLLIPEFLFMFFNRPEFDRYARFNSWGSARETFSWEDFCDIDITLPSIEQQRKYVDVYLALQSNLAVYQSKVDELKLVCDGYFDKAKKGNVISLGELIERVDKRNADGFLKEDSVRGITNKKQFDNTKADLIGTDLSKFLVIDKGVFAYNSRTDGRDMLVLALNEEEHSVIVTWNYNAFRIKDEYKTLVNPEYLYSFFLRSEFDRRVRFNSWGSSQELLSWDNFCDIKVPFPDINEQNSISKMSHVFLERKAIVEQLKEQLNGLCPVLIRGSLEKEV